MTCFFGDVHGQYEKLHDNLRHAGLIDKQDHWAAGDTTLWFMGDYFDHGPDGVSAIDLIRSLQTEAAAAGGRVGALLGNHDVLILAARRFGARASGGPGGTFLASWQNNGGAMKDMARLTDDRAGWLRDLPAMALVGGRLLMHADATFYQVYGRSVTGANLHIRAILHSGDAGAWDQLLDYFSQRRAFQDPDLGPARVGRILALYGGQQLIHGHTPIFKLSGCRPEEISCALTYAGGLAVDVDGGLVADGRGFVTCLPEFGEK